MKTTTIARLLLIALILLAVSTPLSGNAETPQDLSAEMRKAYEAFKSLQGYISPLARFEDRENHAQILALLRSLRNSMHAAEDLPSRFADAPGFRAHLDLVQEALGEIENHFAHGQKDWANWRFRAVTNQCVACHSAFHIDLRYADPQSAPGDLSDFQKGEFYFATRQFDRAQEAYWKTAHKTDDSMERAAALRRWLVIETRVLKDPSAALQQLSWLYQRPNILPYEKEEIKEWMLSFKHWKEEADALVPPLRKAETLLQRALGQDDPLYAKIGAVELLRAAGLLHRVLETGDFKEEVRGRALFLIGVAYAKLGPLYVEEAPEFYLERCIKEYPKSSYAKRAFRLYREIIRTNYTGSGGLHVPKEFLSKIERLYGLVNK